MTAERRSPVDQPDVSGLNYAAAHAAIVREAQQLAAIAVQLSGGVLYPLARRAAGQLRILERHAPSPYSDTAAPWCSTCALVPGSPDPWPCPDYFDIADGMCEGLTRCRST